MAFDSFVTAAVVDQLQKKIISTKIVKIYQPARHTIILKYYGIDGPGKLLLSAHQQDPRIYLASENKENPQKPPLFCMVLRKYLEGGKIISLRQLGLERIVEIEFAIRDDLGDSSSCRLLIEIMGKHSNIILVNKDNIIIDGIHRYSHQQSRHREVLPGRPYIAPPPQNKKLLSGWDEEKLSETLWQLQLDDSVEHALAQLAEGFSPFMVKEVLHRATLANDMPVSELGQYEIRLLNQALNQIYDHYRKNNFSPVLHVQNGQAVDFAAFPLHLWQGQEQPFADISQMLELFYQGKQDRQLFATRKRELLKIINVHHARLIKKIQLQAKELIKSEAGEQYKEAGDLLSAYLYNIEKGASAITVESFYEPGRMIEIELKPGLSPQQNCQRYYRLYNKCKKAYKLIEAQLNASRGEEEYIASVLLSAEQSINLEELQAIHEELVAGQYIKGSKKNTTEKAKLLPPRSFISDDGLQILVGRNNKQNDKLTLKIAAKNDIWLHTQKIPGSHVIIKNGGQEVPERTLYQAASIAAWYSKAKSGSNVPVDYTTVDQVKKPNGAKPGMVIYFQQKTLYINPVDPEK